MNPSALMGSKAMASMGSNLPERDFLSLQTARKVSFKVNPKVRDSRVYAGISVSPATPIFQSDYYKGLVGEHHYVNHEMSISLLDSSDSSIPKLYSEMNFMKTTEGVLPSSHMCCEGLNSDAIGCYRDSAGFVPVELVQDGDLDAKDSGADLLPEDRFCVNRQGIQLDAISQHDVHGEYAVAPSDSGVECNSMGHQLGMNHQSPQRDVLTVPRSDAHSGLSTENRREQSGFGQKMEGNIEQSSHVDFTTHMAIAFQHRLRSRSGRTRRSSSCRQWIHHRNTITRAPSPNRSSLASVKVAILDRQAGSNTTTSEEQPSPLAALNSAIATNDISVGNVQQHRSADTFKRHNTSLNNQICQLQHEPLHHQLAELINIPKIDDNHNDKISSHPPKYSNNDKESRQISQRPSPSPAPAVLSNSNQMYPSTLPSPRHNTTLHHPHGLAQEMTHHTLSSTL
ncbi:hypothetical protein Nepgr_016419 [Nepenthes gracilis]|uniref:Uncharacterized protein n=1 Tax=Nepenthes gracilis TaxID=150966 RepID=A0AAD3XRL3_NEPGR|nr:hypothetical protein Nepgr_016419 [Nepenthes gracilis]